jgi:segregation and condensation protein A
MSFRVELDSYRGPLDLLLYLVRKHEVDLTDIPVALVAEQYVAHLEVLEELNVDDVGEFIEIASTLVELKSQMVLPRGGEETETLEDPREELVTRLLDYKRYKDAASLLDDQSREWQLRYQRLANDLPPRRVSMESQPIREVELWDLVSAFGRIMRDSQATQPSNIVYDDTPINVYMAKIQDRITSEGCVTLSGMFEPGMHKSAMIGVFLAILELVRHHCVETEQRDPHGEIHVLPTANQPENIAMEQVDNYGGPSPSEPDLPAKPR